MSEFFLAPNANVYMTATVDEFEAPPSALVRVFGTPLPSDGYKVSGEYIFADASGRVFTVHDWKSTSLFEVGLPSPTAFWASNEPQEFSIGSREENAEDFKQWLIARLAA